MEVAPTALLKSEMRPGNQLLPLGAFRVAIFSLTKRTLKVIFPSMRTSEILDVLPKLTKTEREEIRLKLAELDGDGWADSDDPLTNADKALIESRVEAHARDPAASIPWEQFDAGLKRRLGE
jgi:putative addiction module component (TIGR02574 family)